MKLHRFNFAPCVTQTPPCLTWFAQSLKLQSLRFFIAPCVTQTPPLMTPLLQPIELHRLGFFFIIVGLIFG
jgi:hypothetical protein